MYGVFCKLIHEKELSKFRTRRAYCTLMEIIGPQGQHLSGSEISQWIKQVADSEKAEHFDESDLISITEKLQTKVKEFADLLKGPIPVSQNNPTDKHLKANLSLLLATAEQNRGNNIKCNGVLMTCDCKDCTPKEQRKQLVTQV
ncbi:uncharacterized protein Dana_GF23163, isoform F [Drosophila ananassae]|uniref:Uncharacterized protein, isoform F n=2 Tax=Drosophila ananassae TaxID=7217 RepID=A0A0P9BLY5_DROAN|nr:uncharacterized protein Dana_GF23163, isoform F [Drosophila ananassae]